MAKHKNVHATHDFTDPGAFYCDEHCARTCFNCGTCPFGERAPSICPGRSQLEQLGL